MELLQRFRRAEAPSTAAATPSSDPPSAVAQSLALFDGAVRASERAWHQSSMLALARVKVVREALATLAQGEAAQVADLLSRMTHETFLAVAPHMEGLEVQSATRLSRIVVGLLADDMALQLESPRDPEAAADILLAATRKWIETGTGRHPDLERIAALVGNVGVRAALAAPLGPAVASLRVVARARKANFEFRDRQPGSAA